MALRDKVMSILTEKGWPKAVVEAIAAELGASSDDGGEVVADYSGGSIGAKIRSDRFAEYHIDVREDEDGNYIERGVTLAKELVRRHNAFPTLLKAAKAVIEEVVTEGRPLIDSDWQLHDLERAVELAEEPYDGD